MVVFTQQNLYTGQEGDWSEGRGQVGGRGRRWVGRVFCKYIKILSTKQWLVLHSRACILVRWWVRGRGRG